MICEMVQLYNPFEWVTAADRRLLGARLLACLAGVEQNCPGLIDRLLRSVKLETNNTLFDNTTPQKGRYLVLSGIAAYVLYAEEQHKIARFFLPGDFIGMPRNRSEQANIKIIKPARLLFVSEEALTQLKTVCLELYALERDFLQQCLEQQTDERIRFATLPAKEHFAYLCQQQPLLMKYVQKKDIAAYLGINPSTLSRWQSAME
ncbi:cAMP-binding domain of CRP or a regulatory subunit of cAMP-dependent protein kinases [Pustulibacterium marinum]|uniref:cAMP-binding domain of CRP or a regulatory subunit of cAMP-dependent protein kinases n=1 Tax=Pustulibacterium marinum TaxID=1224947 RepID=A0A1I7GBC8_9FLAO|nr:Crp/Fnr family transcriptional regulator [Pustulibacterium marinum]SFU45536.1 cAMP-binding domain of CRP or a regulatory subunit of cAMP-dependent protein kinases [Pustulibacterium marinum]